MSPNFKSIYELSSGIANDRVWSLWRRRLRMCTPVTLSFVVACALGVGNAHATKLSVSVVRPGIEKRLNNDSSWTINLQGEIDAAAPARVEEALRQLGASGADIFLDSPGGSLAAAMVIGRMIRKYGGRTNMGTVSIDRSATLMGEPTTKYKSGACFSACALAFLGGKFRYNNTGSSYGVHRFSTAVGASAEDLDIAQMVSASVASYIREMDVDPALFDRMVEEGKDSMRVLSGSELSELNVVNNGREKPTWAIEAMPGTQVLWGRQRTRYGYGRASILCGKKQVLYYSFYDLDRELAKDIISGVWYHSLLIADQTQPLERPLNQGFENETYSALFALSKEQALAAAVADTIGHAMQLGRGAPTFIGYTIDVPRKDKSNVSAFIKNCLLQ